MRRAFVWFDRRFAILLALILFALGHAAHGHDHNHPELNQWMQQLKSGRGSCCDGSDALHLSDVDWVTTPDGQHYRVQIPIDALEFARAVRGEPARQIWVDVPDGAVINEPNKAGSTMVWPYYGSVGFGVRCLILGTMS